MSPTKPFKLKTNSNLINTNFNGYRLSTKNIPSYRINLKKECISKSVTESLNKNDNSTSFNMDKMIACTSHNFLSSNFIDDKHVYFIDTGYNVMFLNIQNELLLPDPYPVCKMVRCKRPDVAPCLVFLKENKNLAVSSDGNNNLYVWFVLALG